MTFVAGIMSIQSTYITVAVFQLHVKQFDSLHFLNVTAVIIRSELYTGV